MSNDPVNKSNEEEYHFSDTEHSTEFSPSRPSIAMPRGSDGMDSRKKIFIVVGVIVALFCLYKLYDVFSVAPVKPKNEMPVAAIKSAETKLVETAKSVEAAPTETVAAAPTQLSSLQDKVGALQKAVSQVSQSNANLQDQMAGVSTAMADIQNNISSLSQQVADLSKAKEKPAETKSAEVKSQKPKAVAKKSSTKKTPPVKKVAVTNYFVKALIQGRAWLMTPDGATMTLSVGDSLPGYGTIDSIDPSNGEVKTSSGAVLRYQSEDK